jgi:hypothetical protein
VMCPRTTDYSPELGLRGNELRGLRWGSYRREGRVVA